MAPSLNLYSSHEHSHHNLVTENLLHETQVPPEALLVPKTNRQLSNRGRKRQTSGFLETFPDLPPTLVQVKASLGAQLDLPCTHPGKAEAATNYGSPVAPNRFPRASHKQCLTWTCTKVPPKSPQNKRTQWPASFSQHQSRFQFTLEDAYQKRNLSRHQNLIRKILLCVVSTCIAPCTLWSRLILRISQPKIETI